MHWQLCTVRALQHSSAVVTAGGWFGPPALTDPCGGQVCLREMGQRLDVLLLADWGPPPPPADCPPNPPE